MSHARCSTLLYGIFALLLGTAAHGQIPVTEGSADVLSKSYTGKSYSPYAERQTALMPLWGDTHLHTDISMDAGAFGNRLGLDEAYRFARGDQVTSSTGVPVRLSRPLDWLVIADHSDNMGFFPDMNAGAAHILADPKGREWYQRIQAGEGVGVALELIGLFSQGFNRKVFDVEKTLESIQSIEKYGEIMIIPCNSDRYGLFGVKLLDDLWILDKFGDVQPGVIGKLLH